MFIRSASRTDFDNVSVLIEAAFGQHDEALLVSELRADGDMALEFVATDRDVVVGHVALSTMKSPARCLALAPVSVDPLRHGKGIGSALIRVANEAAEEADWTAIFVLGNPAYYGRFGYEVAQAAAFDTPFPSEFTAVCVFDDEDFTTLPTELIYPRAFL